MEDKEKRKKRILYQATYRGTKEADRLFGPFAKDYLDKMTDQEMDQFEALLAEEDPDLFDWLVKGFEPPSQHKNKVFQMILDFMKTQHAS